ncbi:MAG: Hsp33 family molecular chaperone HslO [Candidatus Pacebacteria bacterium]|nr:Hsp33 family molecular chaperone HslO [Candidatus Paceibacterota bacterium]
MPPLSIIHSSSDSGVLRIMDRLVKLASAATNIRATYVDTSISARELSQRHLLGPSASFVLGEALAAVSLLSADMSDKDECITLRLDVDGPIQGYLVEAGSSGNLRGYTRSKVLNSYDGTPLSRSLYVLGDNGNAAIVRSLPLSVLSTANLRVDAPCTRVAVARYFNHSMQTPTGVSLFTAADETAVTTARGLAVERMPDGDREAFVKVLELLASEDPLKVLQVDDPAANLAIALGIPDLTAHETRALQFFCCCSHEKAAAVLSTLSPEELREMIDSGKGTTIYCHMCGRGFAIGVSEIQAIADTKDRS